MGAPNPQNGSCFRIEETNTSWATAGLAWKGSAKGEAESLDSLSQVTVYKLVAVRFTNIDTRPEKRFQEVSESTPAFTLVRGHAVLEIGPFLV